jgi:hypothetical protein
MVVLFEVIVSNILLSNNLNFYTSSKITLKIFAKKYKNNIGKNIAHKN